MTMPVVNIRKMRMLVDNGDVFMRMIVWDLYVPLERVLMPVMRFVRVHVTVFEWLMDMFVLVVLGQVQPHAPGHQACSQPECRISRFAEQDQRYRCANERSGGKVGACPRGPEATQGQHEHDEADAITE